MLKILVVIFTIFVQIFATWEDLRIVGGFPAKQGQFPYSSSLKYATNYVHFCGAGIINKRWLLSAAHCIKWKRVTDFVVYVGSIYLDEYGIHYKVEKKVIYTRDGIYDPFAIDIALVRVAEIMVFNELVKPLHLPININVKPGSEATAIGWGDTTHPGSTSNRLMFLTRLIVDSQYCALVLEHQILDSHICFGGDLGHGLCHGDSGSPLIYVVDNKSYVIGVVSWGHPCAAGYPDVYANVSYFVPWILEQIYSVTDL